jgi:hypothetical protein
VVECVKHGMTRDRPSAASFCWSSTVERGIMRPARPRAALPRVLSRTATARAWSNGRARKRPAQAGTGRTGAIRNERSGAQPLRRQASAAPLGGFAPARPRTGRAGTAPSQVATPTVDRRFVGRAARATGEIHAGGSTGNRCIAGGPGVVSPNGVSTGSNASAKPWSCRSRQALRSGCCGALSWKCCRASEAGSCGVSGRLLERAGVVGDTPVRESTAGGLGGVPE